MQPTEACGERILGILGPDAEEGQAGYTSAPTTGARRLLATVFALEARDPLERNGNRHADAALSAPGAERLASRSGSISSTTPCRPHAMPDFRERVSERNVFNPKVDFHAMV